MAETPVCVFCGSRFGKEPTFTQLAKSLGQGLAERALPLVYGGGDVGLMGAVADAVMASGGRVYGYIPERLMDLEVGKSNITELEITTDMFVRKRAMIDRSSAFVALPGGLGTIDELLDAITLKQLGYHNKPVLLLGAREFWQPFMALIEHVIVQGFAGASAIGLLEVCEDEATLWPKLDGLVPSC